MTAPARWRPQGLRRATRRFPGHLTRPGRTPVRLTMLIDREFEKSKTVLPGLTKNPNQRSWMFGPETIINGLPQISRGERGFSI